MKRLSTIISVVVALGVIASLIAIQLRPRPPLVAAARAQIVTPEPTPPSFANQKGVVPIYNLDPNKPTFASGHVDDPTAFPESTVHVHNETGFTQDQNFWLSISVAHVDSGVTIVDQRDYARNGLIPPDGDATYTLRFDPAVASQIAFTADGGTREAVALTLLQFAVESGFAVAGFADLGGHDGDVARAIAQEATAKYFDQLDAVAPCSHALDALQKGSVDDTRFTGDTQACLASPMWRTTVNDLLAKLQTEDWFKIALGQVGKSIPGVAQAMTALDATQFAARLWGMYTKFRPWQPGAMVGSVAFLGFVTGPPATARAPQPTASPSATIVPAATASIQVGSTVVLNDDVSLRAAPSSGAATVTKLTQGTQVKVIAASQSGDGFTWWPVQDPRSNSIGFVRAEFLSTAGPAMPASPVPTTASLGLYDVIGQTQTALKAAKTYRFDSASSGVGMPPQHASGEIEVTQGEKVQGTNDMGSYVAYYDFKTETLFQQKPDGSWLIIPQSNFIPDTLVSFLSSPSTEAGARQSADPSANWVLRGLETVSDRNVYVLHRHYVFRNTIDEELWIDGSTMLPIKDVAQSTVPSAGAGSSAQTITSETTYSDFGAPVDVTVPPAALGNAPATERQTVPAATPPSTADILAAIAPQDLASYLNQAPLSAAALPQALGTPESGTLDPESLARGGLYVGSKDLWIAEIAKGLVAGQALLFAPASSSNTFSGIVFMVYRDAKAAQEATTAEFNYLKSLGVSVHSLTGVTYPGSVVAGTVATADKESATGAMAVVPVGNVVIVGYGASDALDPKQAVAQASASAEALARRHSLFGGNCAASVSGLASQASNPNHERVAARLHT